MLPRFRHHGLSGTGGGAVQQAANMAFDALLSLCSVGRLCISGTGSARWVLWWHSRLYCCDAVQLCSATMSFTSAVRWYPFDPIFVKDVYSSAMSFNFAAPWCISALQGVDLAVVVPCCLWTLQLFEAFNSVILWRPSTLQYVMSFISEHRCFAIVKLNKKKNSPLLLAGCRLSNIHWIYKTKMN